MAENTQKNQSLPLCALSVAQKFYRKKFFVLNAGPPDSLKKELEETGISLEQAVVRIAGLVFLFVCVALVKFYVSTDDFSLADKDREVQSSINVKKIQDDAFELIHTVIPSSANVRSKPSIDGRVIAIVEEGMNLNPIEKKEGWTKIRVFEKTGWIASSLIKSEVQAIK